MCGSALQGTVLSHIGMWCVLQLFRAPRGRIQPLSQMGQDLQAHDRKWLEPDPSAVGIELVTSGKVPGYFCPL